MRKNKAEKRRKNENGPIYYLLDFFDLLLEWFIYFPLRAILSLMRGFKRLIGDWLDIF